MIGQKRIHIYISSIRLYIHCLLCYPIFNRFFGAWFKCLEHLRASGENIGTVPPWIQHWSILSFWVGDQRLEEGGRRNLSKNWAAGWWLVTSGAMGVESVVEIDSGTTGTNLQNVGKSTTFWWWLDETAALSGTAFNYFENFCVIQRLFNSQCRWGWVTGWSLASLKRDAKVLGLKQKTSSCDAFKLAPLVFVG